MCDDAAGYVKAAGSGTYSCDRGLLAPHSLRCQESMSLCGWYHGGKKKSSPGIYIYIYIYIYTYIYLPLSLTHSQHTHHTHARTHALSLARALVRSSSLSLYLAILSSSVSPSLSFPFNTSPSLSFSRSPHHLFSRLSCEAQRPHRENWHLSRDTSPSLSLSLSHSLSRSLSLSLTAISSLIEIRLLSLLTHWFSNMPMHTLKKNRVVYGAGASTALDQRRLRLWGGAPERGQVHDGVRRRVRALGPQRVQLQQGQPHRLPCSPGRVPLYTKYATSFYRIHNEK